MNLNHTIHQMNHFVSFLINLLVDIANINDVIYMYDNFFLIIFLLIVLVVMHQQVHVMFLINHFYEIIPFHVW